MLKNLFALGDLQVGVLYIYRRCFFQPLLVQFRLRVFIQPKIQLRLYSVLSVLLERHIRHGSTQSKPVQEGEDRFLTRIGFCGWENLPWKNNSHFRAVRQLGPTMSELTQVAQLLSTSTCDSCVEAHEFIHLLVSLLYFWRVCFSVCSTQSSQLVICLHNHKLF